MDALGLALAGAVLRASFKPHRAVLGRARQADLRRRGRDLQGDGARGHNHIGVRRAVDQHAHGLAFEVRQTRDRRGGRARVGQAGIDVELRGLRVADAVGSLEVFDIPLGHAVDRATHHQPQLRAIALGCRHDGDGLDHARATDGVTVPAAHGLLVVPGEAQQHAVRPDAPDDLVGVRREGHLRNARERDVLGQHGRVAGLVAVRAEVVERLARLQARALDEQQRLHVFDRRDGARAKRGQHARALVGRAQRLAVGQLTDGELAASRASNQILVGSQPLHIVDLARHQRDGDRHVGSHGAVGLGRVVGEVGRHRAPHQLLATPPQALTVERHVGRPALDRRPLAKRPAGRGGARANHLRRQAVNDGGGHRRRTGKARDAGIAITWVAVLPLHTNIAVNQGALGVHGLAGASGGRIERFVCLAIRATTRAHRDGLAHLPSRYRVHITRLQIDQRADVRSLKDSSAGRQRDAARLGRCVDRGPRVVE